MLRARLVQYSHITYGGVGWGGGLGMKRTHTRRTRYSGRRNLLVVLVFATQHTQRVFGTERKSGIRYVCVCARLRVVDFEKRTVCVLNS